jgi:4'-phosphopantetheinyl transferase
MKPHLDGMAQERPASLAIPVVDVWRANLDVGEDSYKCSAAVLSADEHRRAAQFRSPLDCRRYVVRHGRLRELLAQYLGCDARDVPLACETFSKPRVEGSTLGFSMSHSHGLALFAVAQGVEIGCDIEREDPAAATADAAELFLSPFESRSLDALSDDQKIDAFFRYWTAKEAYLKARGIGLSVPMQTVVVSGCTPRRFIELDTGDPAEWSLVELELSAGYRGALVVRSPAPAIRIRQ